MHLCAVFACTCTFPTHLYVPNQVSVLLCDCSLEADVRRAWHEWCQGRPPLPAAAPTTAAAGAPSGDASDATSTTTTTTTTTNGSAVATATTTALGAPVPVPDAAATTTAAAAPFAPSSGDATDIPTAAAAPAAATETADSSSSKDRPRPVQLDVLVCNAGVLLNDLENTSEGIETTFACHLLFGTYLLSSLARPSLEATNESRLVVVSEQKE